MATVGEPALKAELEFAAGGSAFAVQPHLFSCRAMAGFLCNIESKLAGRND